MLSPPLQTLEKRRHQSKHVYWLDSNIISEIHKVEYDVVLTCEDTTLLSVQPDVEPGS